MPDRLVGTFHGLTHAIESAILNELKRRGYSLVMRSVRGDDDATNLWNLGGYYKDPTDKELAEIVAVATAKENEWQRKYGGKAGEGA